MDGIELFSGCGGLALGLSRAGILHSLLIERNKAAVETVRHNQVRSVDHVCSWNIEQSDVSEIEWNDIGLSVDVVSGGPPCQPFSIGGKARGKRDERDMWPYAIKAVIGLRPAAFLFENVKGLTRPAFAEYLMRIVMSLEHAVELTENELTPRLPEKIYTVCVLNLNAADFGAAQKRHRVLIAGVRCDMVAEFSAITPTHSRERLLWDQWCSGEYWRRHGLSVPGDQGIDRADLAIVRRLREKGVAPATRPWRTVRDALVGLGEPDGRNNHVFQPGARTYPGHTGSPLDQPAKALKAGAHGVPGGENMMIRDDGTVRYFTVREAARLQGFPDDYEFPGSWSETMRQIGNAVPVELAEAAGRWLTAHMVEDRAPSLAAA